MRAPAGPVVGIDLGTTYSCIAHVNDLGQPEVLANEENQLVTPSVVFFASADSVIVGRMAREMAGVHPDRVIELVKRDMGNPHYRRLLHGRDYTPPAIAACILRKLKQQAEMRLRCPIGDAVITVPAYFNEAQRNATELAGELAGLRVRSVIPEPTAAAISYAHTHQTAGDVLVYDLGGGTFDVTVMRLARRCVQVVAIGGDFNLGGRNWDARLAAWFADEWQRKTGSSDDPLADTETLVDFLTTAETTRKSLTQLPSVTVGLTHAGRKVRCELTRDHFDELTAGLLARTLELTAATLAEARRHDISKLDKIILVGGASYMPQVGARLQAAVGVPCELFDPDLAVARGAALYAAHRSTRDVYDQALADVFGKGQGIEHEVDRDPAKQEQLYRAVQQRLPGISPTAISEMLCTHIVNASSKSFGVETLDGNDKAIIIYLISRNSQVPAEKTEVLYTRHDKQSFVSLPIIEAEGDDPPTVRGSHSRVIKQVILNLPPGLPRGTPIQVTYSLSEDGGRLRVRAVEQTSGRSIEETVEQAGTLTPEQVEQQRRQLLQMQMT